MCASGMMSVCYLVPCTSERMNVGSWRARGGARGLLWTSLSYRGMCPRLRGRLPLRPVPVTPPVHALAGANEAESGALVSARLPHQHAACGVWRESGEDSDRARGRRPEAERIAVIRAASRSPAPARVSGRWSRVSAFLSGHDASMRDENDKRRDDRCFVFDRVTSQARRYYV